MFSSFKCRNCKCIGLLLFTSSFLLKKDKKKVKIIETSLQITMKCSMGQKLKLDGDSHSLSLWVLSFPAPEIALDTNTRFSFNFLSDLT